MTKVKVLIVPAFDKIVPPTAGVEDVPPVTVKVGAVRYPLPALVIVAPLITQTAVFNITDIAIPVPPAVGMIVIVGAVV